MRDLYLTNNVVVRSIPAMDTSRWVVTFDHYGIGHGFDRQGFAEDFLRKAGVSAIHVMGAREDWYQYPEMPEAMQTVRSALAGADRVLTYGVSMGGYAAIRFADAARADAVLAISPQYSIDPLKAPFEDRWLQDSRRIAWLPEIEGPLTCRARPVVVFDPRGHDGQQVELIAREIPLMPIPLRHVSHPATTFLAETGLLKDLVFQTLSGEIDVVSVRHSTRRLRKTSGVYLSALASAQPSHRPRLAMALAQRATVTGTYNALAVTALARLLSREGRHDEAVRLLEDLVVRSERDTSCLVHYADSLFAAGRYLEAASIGREVLEATPHLAHLHMWSAVQLWWSRDFKAAIAAAEHAVALAPDDSRCLRLLTTYRRESLVLSPPPQAGLFGTLRRLWRRVRRRAARLGRSAPPAEAGGA